MWLRGMLSRVDIKESLGFAEGMPPRPSALLMPDALDIRSPRDGVLRTPLPVTPLTLSSPSLPSVSPLAAYAALHASQLVHQAGAMDCQANVVGFSCSAMRP